MFLSTTVSLYLDDYKLIFYSGDGMWNDLAMEVQGVETSYNQMPAVHPNKTNAQ